MTTARSAQHFHRSYTSIGDNTERPETLEIGANRLVGTNPATIVEGVREMLEVKPDWANPYGDGYAAKRIHQIISSKYIAK